jgi:hypothetical protein
MRLTVVYAAVLSPAELAARAGSEAEYQELLVRCGYLFPSGPGIPPQTAAPGPDSGRRVSLDQDESLVYRIASFSGNGIYEVRHLPDGRWYCPCADFQFRGMERPCKHIVVAMERQRRGIR